MNVPQLRFDGFNEEWEAKTINDLGTIGRGKSKHRPRNDSRLYGTEYPFVQTSDIKNAGLFLNSYSQAYSKFGLQQSKLWPKGTLCITIAANIAETTILEIDACFPDSIIGFISDKQKSEVIFIKKYFEFISPVLQKLSEGVAQNNLNLEKLKSINFSIPSLKEQKKISDFFLLIEKKFEKQKEKVEKLERFKKEMMYLVFSQEKKFKDEEGKDFPKWEEKKLKDIILSKRKGTEAAYSEKGNVLLHNDYLEFGTNMKFVSNKNNVLEKDILILWDGSQAGNVYTNKIGVLGSTFVALTLHEIYDSQYIYYYLKNMMPFIKRAWREGSGVPHISKDFIGSFTVQIPRSREEQEIIVDYLSQVEKKIEKEKEKLNLLDIQKKSLTLKMFV